MRENPHILVPVNYSRPKRGTNVPPTWKEKAGAVKSAVSGAAQRNRKARGAAARRATDPTSEEAACVREQARTVPHESASGRRSAGEVRGEYYACQRKITTGICECGASCERTCDACGVYSGSVKRGRQ